MGKTPAGSSLPSLSSISGRFLRNKHPPTIENKTHSPDQREPYVLAPLRAGNMRLSWPPLGKWTRSNDQSGCNLIRPQYEVLEISVGIIQTWKRQSDHCQQVCADFHSCGQHSAKALRCWTHCTAPGDIGWQLPPSCLLRKCGLVSSQGAGKQMTAELCKVASQGPECQAPFQRLVRTPLMGHPGWLGHSLSKVVCMVQGTQLLGKLKPGIA